MLTNGGCRAHVRSQHLKCGHLRVPKYNFPFDPRVRLWSRNFDRRSFSRVDKYLRNSHFYNRFEDFGFIEICNQISTNFED